MFENDYLMHYGIKGQKWGVRRYQNSDGSLTTAGRARYSKSSGKRAGYGSSIAAIGALAMSPVVGLGGYNVARKIIADKQSAKNVMYDLERSGALKGLTADQIKKVEKEVKSSVRRNSYNSPVYSTEASARTAGERVASTYKGKKTKYGSSYNALDVANEKKVAKLNKKIDLKNLSYQMGLAKRDAESRSPLATRWNEKSNARDQKALTKLVAKRNALDPSQANRQGRLLTEQEYNKYYNIGKNSTAAQLAFGLPGAAINAIAGSRSKKTHDAEYENYKNSAVSYGSKKKKKRAR